MSYEDKYINCVDCSQEFVHSADDQARYEARGLQNIPKRCPTCREAKRAKKSRGRPGDSDSRARPAPPASSRNDFRHDETPQREPQMSAESAPQPEPVKAIERNEINWPDPEKYTHTVSCAECGKETSVPFKPTDDCPAYCRDCFVAKLPTG